MSPKEQFQSEVSKLACDNTRRHRRNPSISLNYNPYELQHVSSLRVSPPRRIPYKASTSSLRHVVEEPDFGTEERNIWSKGSPIGKAQDRDNFRFVPHKNVEASPSQRQDANRFPPLRRKISALTNEEERPRTRRGPDGPSAFDTMDGKDDNSDANSLSRSTRSTKFVEGTMTSRSGPIASTWSDLECATSESEADETDLETTPKAVRTRRSNSFDLRDFQPPALTPSAIKRTLFRRGHEKKNKEPDVRKKIPHEEAKADKPKKRIRKSMSKLHFLGEKMKIFGTSSQDLPEQNKNDVALSSDTETSVFAERKRKAEAAYAEQFGYKKQKDNAGLVNTADSLNTDETVNSHGNQKYDSSTVRRRGGSTKSRRISTGSINAVAGLARQDSVSSHDIRKRPSRRELEKENQQLRALLRDAQVTRSQDNTALSEVETDSPLPPIPPLKIRRDRSGSMNGTLPSDPSISIASDAANTELPSAPPVPPQHPDRKILGNISNSPSRRVRRESFGIPSGYSSKESEDDCSKPDPLLNVPKLVPTPEQPKKRSMAPRRSMPALPASVSMILEEPEEEVEEKKRSLRSRRGVPGKENVSHAAVTKTIRKREEWQWPEDVF